MIHPIEDNPWDLTHVIGLLHTLSPPHNGEPGTATTYQISVPTAEDDISDPSTENGDLGDFNRVFDFLKDSSFQTNGTAVKEPNDEVDLSLLGSSMETRKSIKWRDEVDGADLEDNVEPKPTAANLRTRDRAARRAKAKQKKRERAEQQAGVERPPVETDTASATDSDLETPVTPTQLSARRRAIIQQQLTPKQLKDEIAPNVETPQNASNFRVAKAQWPVSDPFNYRVDTPRSRGHDIQPLDNRNARERRQILLHRLHSLFIHEQKYLSNPALVDPAFSAHNTAEEGIHVFVDISNVMIGFHEMLKSNRNISLDQRVQRIPFNFHNFSLVLERGRPAAKRVLVGSDNFPHIDQARELGYETNILQRVHKVRALVKSNYPQQDKRNGNTVRYGNVATSGGASSGSESTPFAIGPAKWVEQAVDEILHLKMLESVVDANVPGTMILATGDAAMAEYSGGFLQMVERALRKGWTVELASSTNGLSGLYKRIMETGQWGGMFGIVELDRWAEWFLDVETVRGGR